MAYNPPIDLERLRSEHTAAEAESAEADAIAAEKKKRLEDLATMLAIGERLYGDTLPIKVATEETPSPTNPVGELSPDGPLAHQSTSEALQYVFKSRPGEVVTVESVVEEMLALGWRTDSSEPVDSVRVAVSRWMKKDSALQRIRLGYYRYQEAVTDEAVPEAPPLRVYGQAPGG